MKNFWDTLSKPILALAPMEDVTDAAFRRIIAQKGKPSVFFCEFTSADGLALADEKGQKRLRSKLIFSPIERPVVAQFFSATPDYMARAAEIAAEMGFDGVDINMGCPDRSVEKSGCGAAMINSPESARAVIRAAKKGGLPVSVKTRLGYNADQVEQWVPVLLGEDIAALTIHARTRKEMSAVPARWERVARVVEIRNEMKVKTLILGNGDLKDCNDALEKITASGADGAMLGRAIYGNPWLFANRADAPSPEEKIQTLSEHIKMFDELLGEVSNFATMKKHFKAYISGWDHAKDLRVRLMETNSAVESLAVLASAM